MASRPPARQRRAPALLADSLFFVGLLVMCSGLWLAWPPLALVVGGLAVMAVGWVIAGELRQRTDRPHGDADDDAGFD